jgi:hypothetical protein
MVSTAAKITRSSTVKFSGGELPHAPGPRLAGTSARSPVISPAQRVAASSNALRCDAVMVLVTHRVMA